MDALIRKQIDRKLASMQGGAYVHKTSRRCLVPLENRPVNRRGRRYCPKKGYAYGTECTDWWGEPGKSKCRRGTVRQRQVAANSPWIAYVKDYARRNGVSYRQALREAGPGYRAMKTIRFE